MNPHADTPSIMAVLVLYGRRVEDAASWPTLRTWIEDDEAKLRRCLIHDNSPTPLTDTTLLPDGAFLVHDPANGGTAGAYVAAARDAAQAGCDWLLLLDQDTILPVDYLDRAVQASAAVPNALILIPRIRHDNQLVSPAIITGSGSVRPVADPRGAEGVPTAISSGALVRRSVVADIRFPPELWLDYVDHWLFLDVARRGGTIAVIDTDLSHDLSIRTPRALSVTRLRSILAAERTFYAAFGGRARAMLPIRRLIRAARYMMVLRPALAITVLRSMIGPEKGRRHD